MDGKLEGTASFGARQVGRLRQKSSRQLIVFGALALAVSLYFLPHGGQSCDEIRRCVSQVSLELGDFSESADDWQVQPRGLTLSPDESEAAVVVFSQSLKQSRLVIFDTETGERLAELVNGDDRFWNPTYSNDGTLVAASSTWDEDGGATASRGRVTIWERATAEVRSNHYEWNWSMASDGSWSTWLDDPAGGRSLYYETLDCRSDLGFSNDGHYIDCDGSRLDAIHIQTDETAKAYAYEPGFNSLPAGEHASFGRVIYDPEVTRSSGLVVRGDEALYRLPRSRENVLDLETGSWSVISTAISGDDSLGAVTREHGPGQLDLATPRLFRPAGELYLINMETGVRWHAELKVNPTAARFSLSGESYVLVTEELDLMIFDTGQL